MKKRFLIQLLGLLPLSLGAQQYNGVFIADSLRAHANAVTRLEEVIWDIRSPDKATVKEHHVYTILNESCDYLSKTETSYGKFNTINYFNGYLYDAMGKEIKRMKKKDMEDYGGSDESTLMTDTRYKIGQFYDRSYPYTVDFEEEDDYSGFMNIHTWMPRGINNVSVEHTRFVVIAPKDYQLRYQAFNCSIQPVITTDGDRKIYTWEARNLPALRPEAMQPGWQKIAPYVMVAPSDFSMQGYKGNMTTWNSYGRFFYDLLKGRDVLPDDVKKKVHDLADGLKDPKDKIGALYDFMQKNTHYISIQLGIGGWQPFDASFVATKRYGDCKALSNYMVALLKEAGITAHSVIIYGGERGGFVRESFPCNQFNHVISCVPLKNDTLWLECTSQSMPAGYLGSFTADRYGLLVDETGGTLVRTPKYGVKENLKLRKITASLQNEGDLSATVYTLYKGECQDKLEQYLNYTTKDRLHEYVKSEINLPTYDIVKYDYAQTKSALPSIDENLQLTVQGYAQMSGKRIFINPNVISRFGDKQLIDEDRKNPFEIRTAVREIDTVNISIPTGYQPESVPGEMHVDSHFGKYEATVNVQGDHIIYYRSLERYSGFFTAADYNELVKFYDKIYKSDRKGVVLVKKE